jgi:hypothetical protein
MAKIQKKSASQTINGLCIRILEFIGYEVPEASFDQKLRFHCGLVITSLAMFMISFVSLLNGIGWLVFVFHSVNIFYKLIVLQMQKRIAVSEAEKEKQGMAVESLGGRVSSPYHTQFNMLVVLLVVFLIAIVVTFMYRGDSTWFFGIVSLSSLVVSLAKEVLDGLVSLYNAHGTGHCILKKRNW